MNNYYFVRTSSKNFYIGDSKIPFDPSGVSIGAKNEEEAIKLLTERYLKDYEYHQVFEHFEALKD